MATVTSENKDDLLISYDDQRGWHVEGTTPSGWVNYDRETGEGKGSIFNDLLFLGFSFAYVHGRMENF